MLKTLRAAAWVAAAAWVGLAVARGRFWDARADGLREPAPGDAGTGGARPGRARRRAGARRGRRRRPHAGVVARARLSRAASRSRSSTTAATTAPATSRARRSRETVPRTARASCRAALVPRAGPARSGRSRRASRRRARPARDRRTGGSPTRTWSTIPTRSRGSSRRRRATNRALVSQMVALHCESGWERLLIPAFVFFFRMLYPFAWVNDDRRATAAAAGGCVLIADDALARIGGVERIKGELIDDCALAAAVKGAGGGLWLGLTTRSRSVRPVRVVRRDPLDGRAHGVHAAAAFAAAARRDGGRDAAAVLRPGRRARSPACGAAARTSRCRACSHGR